MISKLYIYVNKMLSKLLGFGRRQFHTIVSREIVKPSSRTTTTTTVAARLPETLFAALHNHAFAMFSIFHLYLIHFNHHLLRIHDFCISNKSEGGTITVLFGDERVPKLTVDECLTQLQEFLPHRMM